MKKFLSLLALQLSLGSLSLAAALPTPKDYPPAAGSMVEQLFGIISSCLFIPAMIFLFLTIVFVIIHVVTKKLKKTTIAIGIIFAIFAVLFVGAKAMELIFIFFSTP